MSSSQSRTEELPESQGEREWEADADAFVQPSDIHAAPPPFVGMAIKRTLKLPTDDTVPPPRPPPPADPFEDIPLPGFVIFGDDTKTSNFFWGNRGTRKSFLVEFTSEEEFQDFLAAAKTPSEEPSLVMGTDEEEVEVAKDIETEEKKCESEVINELGDELKSPTSTSSYLGTLTEEDVSEGAVAEDVNGVDEEDEVDIGSVNELWDCARTTESGRESDKVPQDTSIAMGDEAITETWLHCACVVVADDGIQDIILEQGESGETPIEPFLPSIPISCDTLSTQPSPKSNPTVPNVQCCVQKDTDSATFSDQCIQVPSPPSREDNTHHHCCSCSGSPWRRHQVKIHCCHPQEESKVQSSAPRTPL
uniref:Uncharacterized protein n=1 Tax=Phlebotomus papatasi TaxID=29031 RepID=A0A1B0DCH5_PHLPP